MRDGAGSGEVTTSSGELLGELSQRERATLEGGTSIDTDDLVAVLDAMEYGRALTRADLPGDQILAAEVPSLAGDSRLPAVADALCDAADTGGIHPAVLNGLCQAVLMTDSPALFGDAIARLLASAAVLVGNGSQLSTALLTQARSPAQDATARQVLRAADALAAATQLRVRGFSARFDLFALLDGISGPSTRAWSMAASRAILACAEAWTDGAELAPALKRLTGTAPPTASHLGPAVPEPEQESDFASVLARVELLAALREQDRDRAVDHLEYAERYLVPARTEDDRPDIEVLHSVVVLLRQLMLDATIADGAAIDTLQAAVTEHQWLDPGVTHWVGNRVAANHAAWARLTQQLQQAHARLGEPSWYHAAVVIDDIVDLYRTTRSVRAFHREADDREVRDVIAPVIESGFAAQASLLRHLNDHVEYLQTRVDGNVATEQEFADLPVARELAEAVAEQTCRGDANPKPSVGDGDDTSFPASSAERLAVEISRRTHVARFSTGSLVADTVLETIRSGLTDSDDCGTNEDAAAAADLVAMLLVSFIYDRERATSATRPYLFDQNAIEENLASDIQDYLVGCGQLGSVRTEVRRVGGGRVDIEFAFSGFNLYVELKADSTAVPLGDKGAYLRQTASYQSTDVRVGFLLVLKILKPKTVATHLTDNVEVVTVLDANGQTRYVVALTLSGGRTTPSGM